MVFIPVINHEEYLDDMKKYYGEDDPQVLELVEKYKNVPPTRNVTNNSRLINIPSYTEYVCVNFNISKTGKIRVKIEAPMDNLFVKYYSKGIKPPVDEHIRALKAFGYPDTILERVLDKSQKKHNEINIDAIFGKYTKKSSSKPKKLSSRDSLKRKMKNIKK